MENTNYIGLDLSLSSTGLFILLADGTEHYFNYKNNDKLSKWHKTLSYVNYRDYHVKKFNNYSDNEISKLLEYNKITDIIIKDILSIIPDLSTTIVTTEGFSYGSSNTISLIDLITYATLLRNKLLTYKLHDFIIKSPSTLKLETCKLTYKPIEKQIGGKKPRIEYIYKNTIGISGGRFQKTEMVQSLLDNTGIINKIKTTLSMHTDLLKMKSIPTPISDIVDAIWLVYTTIKF